MGEVDKLRYLDIFFGRRIIQNTFPIMNLRSPSMPGEHPVFLNVNLVQFSFIIAIYPKYRKLKTDYCKGKQKHSWHVSQG